MSAYDRVGWRGEPMTRRQRQALLACEKAVQQRYKAFYFTVPQGSWQQQTSYSGTSHTGAGVTDLQYPGLYSDVGYTTEAEKAKYRFVLRQLREVARQAAFGRGPWDKDSNGNGMVLHFHVCDLDTRGQAETVRNFQVPQYRGGYNGLDAGVRDRFPFRPDQLHKWRYHG